MDHPAILMAPKTQPFGELTSRADGQLPNAMAGRASLPDALFNDPGERLSAGPSTAGCGKAAQRASPIRMTWHTTVRKSIGKVNCKYGREIVRINISEIFDQSRPAVAVTDRLKVDINLEVRTVPTDERLPQSCR